MSDDMHMGRNDFMGTDGRPVGVGNFLKSVIVLLLSGKVALLFAGNFFNIIFIPSSRQHCCCFTMLWKTVLMLLIYSQRSGRYITQYLVAA
ncbi:uncharacterized protein [Cherax quadricarinatus]|uniref:uncharacterized protein isoform X2 n=1 Tax=Cherax quadricarinatus TaxID=27406 RepID=UPI00387EB1A8